MNCICDFNAITPNINCSSNYNKCEGIFNLEGCHDSHMVDTHLETIKILNRNDFISISESDLILLRVQVIDEYNPEFINKTICIKHRKLLGVQLKPATRCCNAMKM